MTRLHALHGGRVRIWLLHHGNEARNAACLTVLVAMFLIVSHFDYQDAINAERASAQSERAAREAVADQLRQERAARGLPRTTFVIEAATPAEASAKLIDVAADLDGWRARNRGVK